MELSKEDFEAIDQIAHRYAEQFVSFGMHTKEDLYQECWSFAMKALPLYDPARCGVLGGFMNTVIKTRIINFKRDHYHDPRQWTTTATKNALLNAKTGDPESLEQMTYDDPLSIAIMNELALIIEGMTFDDAATVLGLPRLAEKVCVVCKVSKHKDDFGDYARSRDGKRAKCKLCH